MLEMTRPLDILRKTTGMGWSQPKRDIIYYRTGEVDLQKSFETHMIPPQAPDAGQGTVYVLGLKTFVQLFFETPNIFLLE